MSLFVIVAFLLPLFVLPITPDMHEYNKMVLFILASIILFFIYSTSSIIKARFLVRFTPVTLALLAVGIFSIISLFLQTPNKITVLTTPLSTTTLLAGFLFYFFGLQFLDTKGKILVLVAFLFSALLTAVFTLSSFIGILPYALVTPAGSLLPTAIFLASSALYCLCKLVLLLTGQKEHAWGRSVMVFFFLALVVFVFTLTLLLYHLVFDQRPILLPYRFGWSIFAELLKNPRTLLLGIGPSNFTTAFTLAKPASINGTNLWNVIFTSSSSFLFTLASETGLLAALAFIAFMALMIRNGIRAFISRGSKLSEYATLIFLFVVQVLLPSSMTIYAATIIVALAVSQESKAGSFSIHRLGRLRYGLLLIPLTITVSLFYLIAQSYLAEVYFKRALDALAKGQGGDAYNHLRAAIGKNPAQDRYRVVFSQTNLAIANSFATQPDTSEDDKQKIPRLAQQAIDEARMGVSLNRTNALVWENLATIYGNLINFAQGADGWAIESYKQKLQLDPKNPATRISYGGLLLQLKRYEEAEGVFQEAVDLKPDFANGWYNLGFAQSRQGKTTAAGQSYQKALSYTQAGSKDYAKIQEQMQLGKEGSPPIP